MAEFRVDDYTGTDSQRLSQACLAALKAIPSTVILPSRELILTTYQNVRLGVNVHGQEDSGIFLDYSGSASPSGSSPVGLRVQAFNSSASASSVFKDFSIRARTTGYYRLLNGLSAWNLEYRNLDFGVCGQSFLELRGCQSVLVDGCVGRYGGDNSYQGQSAIYKVSIVDSEDVELNGVDMGHPLHDKNQSFVTVNSSHNVHVHDSVFLGTRTYCLNTHGTGSTNVVFENNDLYPGPNAHYGAILVGNEFWGPDFDVIVRNNTMIGEGRFLQVRAGSTVHMSGNIVPPCSEVIHFPTGLGGGVVHVSG